MDSYQWSNEPGPRSRGAWLILRKDGELREFKGETIQSWVVVVSSRYTKNGKWSHTTYQLALGAGVVAIPGRNGWETGRWTEGVQSATGKPADTWQELAVALGVSEDSARAFVSENYPKTGERLTQTDAELAALK